MSQPPSYPPGQGDWDASGQQGSPAPQPYPPAPAYSEQQAYAQPNPKPNTGAFGKAFAAAGVTVLVLLGLIILAWGLPGSGEGAGRVVGRMMVPAAIAGGVVGLIAKGSRKLWPWWQYYLLTAPAVLVLMVVLTAGSLGRG